MTDEQDVFDPTLAKKKKKKKPFGMDENDATLEDVPVQAEIPSNDKPSEEIDADGGDLLDLTLDKKKKKKKKPLDLSEIASVLPEQGNEEAEAEVEEKQQIGGDDDTIDFSVKKKKKKKDKTLTESATEKEEVDGGQQEVTVQSECDYTYETLLSRVFEIMREKNPDMVAGEKKKFVMKPPQVMRVGTKKTSFCNFAEICKMLHRQPKHLLAFLLSELGTSGSLDGNSQLIIKGRFQQKQIESVLRRYIREYVTCHTCKSPETMLQKDTRLYFLQCETCGSRCSVASIKSGFQALTGKRAAIRARTA